MRVELADGLAGALQWSHVCDGRLDTPLVVVDLSRVEGNIRRAQEYCDVHALRFRPHVKTHKLPAIARMQVAAGAVGITCQTLTEAEAMADAGLDDILITFPILGEHKVQRLAALAARTTVAVAADSPEAVEACAQAAAHSGRTIGFLIECDTGLGRLGVQSPDEAARLARVVDRAAGVRLDGLMTYPTAAGSADFLQACLAALEEGGSSAAIVSGGGTPTLYRSAELSGGVINEVRAGEYVFGDRTHLTRGVVTPDEIAAVVLATVVGRPTSGRVILDAGSKALSSDAAGEQTLTGYGLVAEYPDAVIYALSEEHAHVDVSGCERTPRIGERVAVIPNHICPCVNLADRVVLRNRDAIEIVPVTARGVAGHQAESREEHP